MFKRERQGVVNVIAAAAPINHEQRDALAHQFEQCLGAGQPLVVLDIASVPFLDSAGLEHLLDWGQRFRQLGGALKLAAANPLAQDILRITGVDQELEVCRDARTAVREFIK